EGVRVSYSPFGLLSGRYTFRRLSADRMQLILRQYPEGDWNFDRIFRADEAAEAQPEGPALPFPPPTPYPMPELDEQGGTRVTILDGEVRDGTLALLTPWAHDLTGQAREAAIDAARRGEEIWNVEPEGDGWVRALRLEGLRGRFPLVRLVEPGRPVRIELEGMRAKVRAVRQPLEFLRFDGSLVFGDSVRIEIRRADLGASRLTGRGWIASGEHSETGHDTDFRFDLEGDPIGFADLQWLPIPIPREGGGPGEVVIRRQAGTGFVELRKADVSVRDSRMTGGMIIRLGEMPRFDSLSMEVQPLRLSLVDELLERETLIDGYLSGPLEGTGPLDAIDMVADLVLADLEGEGEPSYLRAAGKAGLVEPRRLGDLALDLEEFEPRWAAVVGLPTRLGGRLNGQVTVDGVPGDSVRVTMDVEHRTGAGALSRVSGEMLLNQSDSTIELSASLEPLQLTALDVYLPRASLVGFVRGPISLAGALSDLRARADLATPRGSLRFDGTFDLASERKRYDAEVVVSGIELHEWIEGGPSTQLAAAGRVSGEGTDPATLEARFDLEILPSVVEGARIESSLLRFTLARGVATVDTFAIRSELGSIDGRGSFGLAEESRGTLLLDVRSDLARWSGWPSSGWLDGGEPGAEEGASDALGGTLVARGSISGNRARIALVADISIRDAAYGGLRADSLSGHVRLSDLRSRDTLALDAVARGVSGGPIGAEPLDSLVLRLDRSGGPWTAFAVFAERAPSAAVELAGEIRREARGAHEAAADLADTRETAAEAVADAGLDRTTAVRLARLDVRVRDRAFALERPSYMEYGGSGLLVEGFALADRAGFRLAIDGAVPASGKADLRLALENLPLEAALELAPGDVEMSGVASGNVRVLGSAEAPRIEGRLSVDRPQLDSAAFRRFEAGFSYENRRIRAELELAGDGSTSVRAVGEVEADLSFRSVEERVPEDAAEFTVSVVAVPFELVRMLNRDLTDVKGSIDGELRVRGRPGGFRYDGELVLSGGSTWIVPLEVRYVDMRGRIRFSGEEARLDSFSLRSALGGTASATGTIGLASFADPAFDLDLRVDEFYAIDKREMALVLTGVARLGGTNRAPDLSGAVRVSDGHVRLGDVVRGPDIVNLTDPEIASLIDTTVAEERRLIERERRAFLYNLRAELQVEVGPNAWLRAPEMDVELAGELDVIMHRAEQDMRVSGELHLVRGSYRFQLQDLPGSREFKIDRGTVEFTGAPTPNPRLDVVATH
ncbi:MAG: translocation/assembly module TamB domain-containing protein, partial [Gemmatimonadota bacterium]